MKMKMWSDKTYGQFDVCLCDDGTIDTVISVSHALVETREYRYNGEYAAQFKNEETGTMTDDGFIELAQDALEIYIEQCLI